MPLTSSSSSVTRPRVPSGLARTWVVIVVRVVGTSLSLASCVGRGGGVHLHGGGGREQVHGELTLGRGGPVGQDEEGQKLERHVEHGRDRDVDLHRLRLLHR